MKRGIVFLMAIVLISAEIRSQKTFDFDSYNIEDGFSASKANVIIQDRQGFIWIGTWNGLTRFDGYECVVYTSGINNPNGLSNKEVVSLLEDHKGNIWIGTSDGLNKLNPKTGKIEIFDFESRIISLYEDSDYNIWVGTWSDGLFMLNPENEHRVSYLPHDVISDIIEDQTNEFWVATYQGLVNLNPESKSFKRYLPDQKNYSHSVPHNVVTQLVTSDEGDLWIGTWGGGLSKMIPHFDKDSIRFKHYQKRDRAGSISSNNVYRLFIDESGDIWIGTWDAGVSLLQKSEQKKEPSEAGFINLKSDVSEPYSISGNNITALYVDRSGVLWVGSAKIDKASVIKTGISYYSTRDNSADEAGLSIVKAFTKGYNDCFWVGCSDGLTSYVPDGDHFKCGNKISRLEYFHNGQLFRSNSVLSLCSSPSGLFVGTDDAGLLFFPKAELAKGDNASFRYFNNQTPQDIPGNKVNSLCASKKYHGVVWLGTMQNGFSKILIQNEDIRIENFLASESGLADNNIRDIHEDSQGMVWIATQKGLSRFNPVNNKFLNFFSGDGEASINDNVVNCLHEDASGNLWIGTNNGLNRMVEKTGADDQTNILFKKYPDIDNLNSSLVMNILEGDSAHIYIGFYDALVKFDYSQEKIVDEYFMKEYLHLGIERNSSFRDNAGNLFLGGRHGFIVFENTGLNCGTRPPEIKITDLLVFNKSLTKENQISEGKSSINNITYSDSIILSHKDRVFTFTFSAMDYKSPEKNSYSYILEGFDDEWNNIGERNTATYTNVPPGEYVLKVKAKNSLGTESEQPAQLFLTITPPWWQTIWAYSGYALLLIGLLYFFKQYSIIKVREKSRLMLEKVHHEKDREVYEHKVHFFTNITHEFRTPLTLILGPAEELLQKNDLPSYARRSIEVMHRNTEKLLRLVNQLMEFRKVEKGKMELLLQKVNIVPILLEMHETFRSMARSRKINFTVDYSPPDIIVWVDRDKIEKVLYNLLSNAFRYSDDNSKISVRAGIFDDADEHADSFFLEVTDNGMGIPEENHDQIFESFYQINQKGIQSTGGIGLYLCKIFVEQHKGIIQVDSEPGKGSCFRVIIPMNLDKISDSQSSFYASKKEEESSFPELSSGDDLSGNDLGEEKYPPDLPEKMADVLLVEDDGDMSEFIREGLSIHFNIHTASNGKEAFDMARKIAPDIIISDVMMPGMDGFELARLLRSDLDTSHIPLVFLTAKTLREDEIEGLRLGVVDYIYKPFNMVSLRLKLLNILEARGENREKFKSSGLLEPEKITLSSLDEEFLTQAVKVIDENVDDPNLDVEKLSRKLSLSTNQTYRKIKALTGFTAKEFIRVQRLKIAADLLAQNKRTISEIIYMVGFSSPSYFSRCFKEQYNCTPSEYVQLYSTIENGGKNGENT